MSWAALASNQCVSCNNLQDAVNTSVFVLKNTIPVSTKQITVAEAENYVYIAPIQGKASNELVVKYNLVAGFSYFLSYSSTQGVACINNDPIEIISNTNPIGVGSILNNADGSQAFYPYYYSDGTNWYYADGNDIEQTIVQSTGSCAPTSFTINWDNNFITTGTNQLEIYKNGTLIVNQSGQGNGSFSIIATDIITYTLSSTTPNFTYALISVNTSGPGTVSDCNFNSAYASETGGISFNSNTTIDGITIDYIDGCP